MDKLYSLLQSGCITKEAVILKYNSLVNHAGKQKEGFTQCWYWKQSVSSGGYGQLMIKGIPLQAHRLSYAIHNDRFDLERLEVIGHLCDNKECSNPEHLENITHAKNIKDAYDRGLKAKAEPKERARVSVACEECRKQKREACSSGDPCDRCVRLGLTCVRPAATVRGKPFVKGGCSGSDNANSKLTDEQRAEIVEIAKKGFRYGERKKLAEKYDIAPAYINELLRKAAEADTISHTE
jgi:hypothetical protein